MMMRKVVFGVFVFLLIFQVNILTAESASGKVLYDRASKYLDSGQDEFAMMSFREILRDHPSSNYSDEAMFRLGEYHYNQRNQKEAKSLFDKHERKYPSSIFAEKTKSYLIEINSIALIKKGNELYNERKWEEALVVYTKLIEDNPKLTDTYQDRIVKCKKRIAEKKKEFEKRKARIEASSMEAEMLAADIKNGTVNSVSSASNSKANSADSFKTVIGKATSTISVNNPLDRHVKLMERKFNLSMRSNDGNPSAAVVAMLGPLFLVVLSISIVIYIFSSFCLQTIARNTDTEGGWLAWIPLLNIILMCDIARRPKWWFFLFFLGVVPFFGAIIVLILFVILWMGISEQCGKPNWLGVLTLIPLGNLFLLGYLAFSKRGEVKKKEEEIEKIDDLPPPPAPVKF